MSARGKHGNVNSAFQAVPRCTCYWNQNFVSGTDNCIKYKLLCQLNHVPEYRMWKSSFPCKPPTSIFPIFWSLRCVMLPNKTYLSKLLTDDHNFSLNIGSIFVIQQLAKHVNFYWLTSISNHHKTYLAHSPMIFFYALVLHIKGLKIDFYTFLWQGYSRYNAWAAHQKNDFQKVFLFFTRIERFLCPNPQT